VFPKFVGEELRDDVVKATLNVEKKSRGFHTRFLRGDDFLF
jgi:hypothetical protein